MATGTQQRASPSEGMSPRHGCSWWAGSQGLSSSVQDQMGCLSLWRAAGLQGGLGWSVRLGQLRSHPEGLRVLPARLSGGPQGVCLHVFQNPLRCHSEAQLWSWGVPHQPCMAAASCMHRHMCARDTCVKDTHMPAQGVGRPLGVAFAFSTMQVGIEANPKV